MPPCDGGQLFLKEILLTVCLRIYKRERKLKAVGGIESKLLNRAVVEQLVLSYGGSARDQKYISEIILRILF